MQAACSRHRPPYDGRGDVRRRLLPCSSSSSTAHPSCPQPSRLQSPADLLSYRRQIDSRVAAAEGTAPPWGELEGQLRAALESALDARPLRQPPRDSRRPQRVLVVTDIHVDKDGNADWLDRLSRRGDFANDVLLLCGDVADNMDALLDTLEVLSACFGTVFFMPGNHDLWVRGHERHRYRNSIEKLADVLRVCEELGVNVGPAQVGDIWISPLWSWHHASFDKEPDIDLSTSAYSAYIQDYSACKFPVDMPGSSEPGSDALALWFDILNDAAAHRLAAREPGQPLISFSHFLPLQALLPEKRFLYLQALARAVGSDPLAQRVRSLSPDVHCFGHTHFSWDQTIDGVRYIQAPLCYPKERAHRLPSLAFGFRPDDAMAPGRAQAAEWLPVELYRSGPAQAGEFAPCMSASWSDYYSSTERDPSNVEPAPWVAKRIAIRRSRALKRKAAST